MRTFALSVLLAFTLWTTPAHALICASPSLSGVTATSTYTGGGSGYNPFDTSVYSATVNFTVNVGIFVGTCNYFVVLAAGSGGSATSRQLAGATNLGYVAYTDGTHTSPLLSKSTAGINNAITGSFTGIVGLGQNRTHSFIWRIPALQVVPRNAGNFYSDTNVQLELYEGTVTGTATLVATAPVTFRTQVASSVDVAVTGSGGSFNIGNTGYTANFGTATTGAVRDFDMVVRSNDGYRLTMASARNQTLWRGSTSASGTIPYSLTVNSVGVNLASGADVSVATYNGTTPTTGTNVPVRLTLGTVPALQPAGTYTDTLTVKVSAF
ncbi:MAG: hypothetical protein DI585_01105 [Pseudomonas fluorescens]|nr:MAG: hypothetical protein DI585_01105 [Pseudomonas fluorescens]